MSFDIIHIKGLKGASLLKPFNSSDLRCSFEKVFEKEVLSNFGIDFSIQEVFISRSKINVIRGLYFQYLKPQAKLVTVLNGSCRDVIVDLRKDSPTYKSYRFFDLNDINNNILYVPKGFAHGFLSLSDDMMMLYMCDEKYDKSSDTGIIYNDEDLNINWGG